MPRVRYQRLAEADLDSIGAYTLERWGPAQCDRYLGGLETCCNDLAKYPSMGRVYRGLYLRHEHGSHVVFFRREPGGDVLVIRILHQRMLPELHLDDEDEDEE